MSTVTALPELPDDAARFIEEVRVLMVRRNMNQSDVALALGVGQAEVSKRLKGRTSFKLDDIVALARLFNVSVGELFGETTNAPRPDGPEGGQRARRDSNPKPSGLESSQVIDLGDFMAGRAA